MKDRRRARVAPALLGSSRRVTASFRIRWCLSPLYRGCADGIGRIISPGRIDGDPETRVDHQ